MVKTDIWHLRRLSGGDVPLRRVEIDVDAAVAQDVGQSTYPDRRAWVD